MMLYLLPIACSFLFLCISMCSCGMHYATVAPSAPLLREAGDFAVSANVSSGTGWSGSVAFAPLKHLSLLVEGSTLGGNSDTINQMSQFYQSFGAALGSQFRYSELFLGDAYAGFAKGWSLFDGHGGIGTFADSGKANFHSFFAQSAIGLCYDLEDPTDIIGYQLRLSYLLFDDYFSLLQYRRGDPNDRDLFTGHSDVLISEHSFFIMSGPEHYKLTAFITIPRVISGKTDDLFIEGAIGIGLQLRHNMFGAP